MTARPGKTRKAYRAEPPPSRFSRQWFLHGLHDFAWVAVITILVWVYADIQFTDKENISAKLRIHTGSDENLVLMSRTEIPLVFRVQGNSGSIDAFTKRLEETNLVLDLDAARKFGAGQHAERVADLLLDLPEFRGSGLEILSVQPSKIDIYLDKLVTIPSVPVRFKYTGPVILENETVEPPNIDLKIPESQAKNIDRQGLILFTSTVDLSVAGVGKTQKNQVEVLPPPNIRHARLDPKRVTVTYEVRQQTGSEEFAVTVDVQFPNAWLANGVWSQYELRAKPPENWTRQITVVGNRIDLEKLGAEQIRAYIVLTDEDINRPLESWWPGKVRVEFPPGLKVRLSEAQPVADVQYRLVKRSEPPASTP